MNLQTFINYTFFSILLLYPLTIIIGSAAINFFLSVISIYIIINFRHQIIESFKSFFYIKIILLFFIYTIFITLYNNGFNLQDENIIKNILYLRIFVFSLFAHFIVTNININFFLKLFYICFHFLLIFLFFDVSLHLFYNSDSTITEVITYKPFYWFHAGADRYSSIFHEELILGSFVSKYFFPISTILLIYKIKFSKLLFLLSNFLILFIVINSGERAAMVVYSASLIIFLFLLFFNSLKSNKKIKKRDLIFIFSIILSLSIFSVTFLNLNESYKSRLFDLTYKQATNYSDTNYFKMINNGILYNNLTNNHVFGNGYKSFKKICNEVCDNKKNNNNENIQCLENHELENNYLNYKIISLSGCYDHPHNIYFEIYFSFGLIGLFIFTSLLLYFIIKYVFFRIEFLNIFQISIISVILANFIPLLPSGSILSTNLSSMISYLFVLLFLSSKINKI